MVKVGSGSGPGIDAKQMGVRKQSGPVAEVTKRSAHLPESAQGSFAAAHLLAGDIRTRPKPDLGKHGDRPFGAEARRS